MSGPSKPALLFFLLFSFFLFREIAELRKQVSNPLLNKGKGKEVLRPQLPQKTSMLWTDKYRPKDLQDIIGNKGHVDRILHWLLSWYLFFFFSF